jgi:general secretion pathway protein K
MNRRASNHGTGSALLLVLWVLLVLSAAVMVWAQRVQGNILLHGQASREVEARAMAHSGLAIALHPAATQRTPVPPEELNPGMGYEVRMISEGGNLNINWLLRGEEPEKLALLKRWLERRGLDFDQREAFVDSLLDYVDADNIKRLNGREDGASYRPANRELQDVEEIAAVWGAGPLTSQPDWKDGLTIFSQGPVALRTANVDVLRLLPGLGELKVQQFVELRRGPDGIDGTGDDKIFQNLDSIREFFGLTTAQFEELGKFIGYDDPTLRITCLGHSGNVTRQVEVIVRKGTATPKILSWKE